MVAPIIALEATTSSVALVVAAKVVILIYVGGIGDF